MPFPWGDVMAFGLGRLAWPPDRFWAATPREIAAAMRAYAPDAAMAAPGRETLRRLMLSHPDI